MIPHFVRDKLRDLRDSRDGYLSDKSCMTDQPQAAAAPAKGASTEAQPSGKPKVGKIVVDRNLCIGAASCVVMAPNTFELDAENKAIVKELAGNTNDEIWQAAESCPTKAILLYDEAGKQIYP